MKQIISILLLSISLAACQSNGTNSPETTGYHNYRADSSEGAPTELEANVGDRVFFELNSTALDADAQDALMRQAAWLKRNSSIKITVEGHCDERGPREYNLGLGERRANSVKKFLISAGVDANRISTISYGKERPAVSGSNAEAWSKNRRAVTVVAE